MKFSAVIRKEDRFYVARCPELNVTSQGKTFEEAKDNLVEAIELYVESFGADDIPEEKEPPIWTSLEVHPHA
ncbi:MAG: type II toxin-antitoxin system HicB family antitoxin [Deltaproteobacteria bacterium]|nr:type II toxin-antitoxin system HicB family antitoxin [Deltaproteobacteria bacterium]